MSSIIKVDKTKTIILYLAKNVKKLYVTKLMKLLYYIDFLSYAERGSSVTNDIYYKLPYGPVPSFVKSEIDNLEGPVMEDQFKSQFSDIIDLKNSNDQYGKIVTVKEGKSYDLRLLPEYEKDLIDVVIKKLGDKSASYLTRKTHREKPYLSTSENAVIDYGLAKLLGGRKVLK